MVLSDLRAWRLEGVGSKTGQGYHIHTFQIRSSRFRFRAYQRLKPIVRVVAGWVDVEQQNRPKGTDESGEGNWP